MLNLKKINNLTLTELNRVKELLTSLLEEKSINIKLFQRAENVKGYKLNNLCLMMIPSESRPKDLKYPFIEYTGKAVYLPKYMSEHINSRYCGHLFNRYFNKDIKESRKYERAIEDRKLYQKIRKELIYEKK